MKARYQRQDIVKAMPTRRYLALVRKFPLRPIRSEEENEAALAVIQTLGERQQERPLEPEEHDYIAVMAKLIEEYEKEHYPSGPVSGAAMLAHPIEARRSIEAGMDHHLTKRVDIKTISELIVQPG